MNRTEFEYFLNAVHYCLWRWQIKVYAFMEKLGDVLFSPLKYLFTDNFRKRYHESKLKLEPQFNDLYYNDKNGFCVAWAHHLMGTFCTCYPLFLSFSLLGLGTRLFGGLNSFVALVLIFVPSGICYIPVYKALYTKDRYLKYFKKFEKEDEQWHRKWSRITTLFCVGAALFFIGGIFAMILLGPH